MRPFLDLLIDILIIALCIAMAALLLPRVTLGAVRSGLTDSEWY